MARGSGRERDARYVIAANGPYFNGRTTPAFSLSVLLMDHSGMPVPYFTVAYKGGNGDAIKHLVDLDKDGKAELLISTYDEEQSDPWAQVFCSGHWVTQAYQFRDYAAVEFRGSLGGMAFPFVHKWSYGREKCGLETPRFDLRPPPIYDHGTYSPTPVMTRLHPVKAGSMADSIVPVKGCELISSDVVVVDGPKLRQISFPTLRSEYPGELMEAIEREGLAIRLMGIQEKPRNGYCRVNLLWAK